MKNFKISTIIPVYNVEKYLEETILSIIKQSIGFENIQMILVNDGSPDNSEEICLKYKEMYPENIIYVKKENGGVSSARNKGLEYATGKYIHFMDSDDRISKNFYKKGLKMLENSNISVVCFRIKMFDAARNYHNMDYRFKGGDKIVDLTKDYQYPLYHMPTALIKKELLNDLKFDIKLKISEDVKFMSEVVVRCKKIGIIASELYYYRKRQDESSAIQSSSRNLSFYFDTPKYSFQYVLDLAKKYPNMKKYLQNAILNDVKWRIFECSFGILNDNQKKEYIELIRDVLLKIDDEVIVAQKHVDNSLIFRELSFKYNKQIGAKLKVNEDSLCFNKTKIFNLNELVLKIYCLDIENNNLNISCCLDCIYNSKYDIYVKSNGKYIKCNKSLHKDGTSNIYDSDFDYLLPFYDISLDLEKYSELEFYIEIENKKYKLNLEFIKFSKINNCKNSCYCENGYVVTHFNNVISIGNKKPLFINIKYMFELFKKKEILPLGLLGLYLLTYPFVRHNNWIISDRYDCAGDSGEHLFKYIKEHDKKKNIYYALKKNSKDYDRMKKIGCILPINSIWYYIKYLNAELVASSHIDGFINNPFGKKSIYLNAFCKRKFVFLQHGVTKDNISGWVGKFNKNVNMFICSSKGEYDSIINIPDYMYDENIVKLTGLPRFDNLFKGNIKEEKLIALMPTWRSSLVGDLILGTQDRKYNYKFKESEYYQFYNGLISNNKLLDILKQYDYKILFCLHPSMKAQLDDFEKSKFVNITFYPNYSDVFKKSKLMITDYSSVFFDFAYLKKPVIYTQFDSDKMSSTHIIHSGGKGYFEYERDAFGDVVYNLDDAIDKVITLIKNDCKMEKKYKDRVDKFFAFSDDKNCERVYNEIKKLMNID